MKKIIFFLLILISFSFITSCGEPKDDPTIEPDNPTPEEPEEPIGEHKCVYTWVYPEEGVCGELVDVKYACIECGNVKKIQQFPMPHDGYEIRVEPTCKDEGTITYLCHKCDYRSVTEIPKTEHKNVHVVIDEEAGIDGVGRRHLQCLDCGKKWVSSEYAGNGFSYHGKLSVDGPDLVDQNGNKFQLYGLSTHGLQWFNRYVNFESFYNIQKEFGINVIRLSLYPDEGGYSDCDQQYKDFLFNVVCTGIEACIELDMYVILDWHMLGSNLHKADALDVFQRISEKYKEHDNIIYEIMNEPYGSITWNDCKQYAIEAIQTIRANQPDAVVLVGSPKYSTDLASIYSNPLSMFRNIMYTYHFYAASHRSQYNTVESYYNKGLPIFISEHGGMQATGDGPMNYTSVGNWYSTLDRLNISYVAWNISNSKGSASILISGIDGQTFADDTLKEWGKYYKTVTRTKANLDS